eukprot:TRINITY_DN5618_c0_g1_i4.p1 TRINITY_DN5618_c0_g1~~TRINITY_DN5618_c0_g1_i4.p1  ORF type:complete len:179 (-),score=46.87 TRINITY_DN5618_c0_g1_i4:544-1080(-)
MGDDFDKRLNEAIGTVPDFPKPGIMFRDIMPVLANPPMFKELIAKNVEKYRGKIDVVAGIDSRGFFLGAPIALELGLPFICLRKKGKLPGKCIGVDYALEYGTDSMEAQVGAVKEGQRVLVCDDLIATGGTAGAACQLIEQLGGTVAEMMCVIELVDLKGREKLGGRPLHAWTVFKGE